MSALRIKSELVAIRSRIDEVLEELERNPDAREPSPWMTMTEYAEHAHVSTKTVKRWLDDGMPHAKAPIRIHRDKGDEWRTK